jgi:hypothetical protein
VRDVLFCVFIIDRDVCLCSSSGLILGRCCFHCCSMHLVSFHSFAVSLPSLPGSKPEVAIVLCKHVAPCCIHVVDALF